MWKFKPILKPTIWGGRQILSLKGLDADHAGIGESWEISGLEGDESVVDGGPDAGLSLSELIDKYNSSLLGERIYKKYGSGFPLLIKIINSTKDLSVQVHPDDTLARELGYECGKAEMWIVADTGANARIANGFNREVAPEEYDHLVESGKIENVLNYFDIFPGDIYYIPPGRVHAICGESLIIEIQQTSDVTFRIYDYNRLDASGQPRELHTELARRAINFNDFHTQKIDYAHIDNVPVNVLKTPYFCTNVLKADTELMRDYKESDSFVILICTGGIADITCGDRTIRLKTGNTVLVPASAPGITISPQGQVSLIESYIN